MRLIYTCPKCGADLDEAVLTTYPPKYMKVCKNMKCGWHYIEEPEEDAVVRIPYEPEKKADHPWPIEWTKMNDDPVPECCRRCSNHPANGGSGICNCTLPYLTQTAPTKNEWTITTSATDTNYMFGGKTDNAET